ncbi:MAG: hypothetical protein R2860_08965 [Desulfobacterales bacterium]
MKKPETDYILTAMLDSAIGSQFYGRQAAPGEAYGELTPVDMKPPLKTLTPFQTEIIALNLIGSDAALETLLREGSCDLSYLLPGKAVSCECFFPVRTLFHCTASAGNKVPTIKEMGLPENIPQNRGQANGIVILPVPPEPVKPLPAALLSGSTRKSRCISLLSKIRWNISTP